MDERLRRLERSSDFASRVALARERLRAGQAGDEVKRLLGALESGKIGEDEVALGACSATLRRSSSPTLPTASSWTGSRGSPGGDASGSSSR